MLYSKEVKDWIKTDNTSGWKSREKNFKKHQPIWYDDIIIFKQNCHFDNFSFQQLLYHYINEIDKEILCESGHKKKFRNICVGYSELCELYRKCPTCSKQHQENIEKTNLEKYGTKTPAQNKDVLTKMKETFLLNYGVDNPQKNDNVKNKTIETCLEKYGNKTYMQSDDFKLKSKESMIENYGVEYSMQSKEIQEKSKETCLSKYGEDSYAKTQKFKDELKEHYITKFGTDNPFILDIIKNKKIETCLKKYGVEYAMQYDEVKEHFKNSMLEKYGVENAMQSKEIQEKVKETCLSKYGVEYYVQSDEFKNHIKKFSISKFEIEIKEFVKSIYKGTIIENDRNVLGDRELDIYLPCLNLAIECNGLYWHSELYKDKNYHLDKYKDCLKSNIQLLQIWSDDWIYKKDIVKSIIKSKIGVQENKIYARKCTIKDIDSYLSKNFLNENHLQGNVKSSIKLGLFYNDELVSVMTFGGYRKSMNTSNCDNEYELYRFSNKINTFVVGGFSKLLNYFINTYKPKKIITYASCDISNGNVYLKNNFIKIKETGCGYYWIIKGVKHHRFNYTKNKLVQMGYDKNKTEVQIMHDLGYYRCFDSGNLKFEYILREF